MHFNRITGVIPAVSALSLSLAGCPSGGGGGVSFDDFPEEYARVTCALVERCPTTATTFEGDCMTHALASYEDSLGARLRDGIANGTIVYHGDAARSCFDAVNRAECLDSSAASSDCLRVFEGTLAAGATCHMDEECRSGECSGCPGTCVDIAREGEDCSARECGYGLACQSAVCVPLPSVGEPCLAEGSRCAQGLTCDDSPGGTNLCHRPGSMDREVGETCSYPSDLCRSGLYCVATDGGLVCQSGRVERDGACQPSFPDRCPSGQFCRTGSDGGGTCTDRPGLGDPCSWDLSCNGGLWCDESGGTGVCRARGRLGSACTSGEGCYSSSCDGSVCVAPEC